MKNNRYCLLTGASGGIGAALATALAEQGYTLVLQGRNEAKLRALQEKLGSNHLIVVGDLSCAKARADILQKAFQFGFIDLLVNSAGISHFGEFSALSQDQIGEIIKINLTSPIQLTQAFLQKIGANQATVINVGSAFGAIGFPGFDVYCASKFGLRGFTESLARELAGSPVRVAYFAPRSTQTEINSEQVINMNKALANKVDSVDVVAREFIKLLRSKRRRGAVGWPEKLFARLNGVFPELVDRALQGKLPTIKKFITAKKFTTPIQES